MTAILIIVAVAVFVALVAKSVGGDSHGVSAPKTHSEEAKKSGFVIRASSNFNDSKEREDRLMVVLERLIEEGDDGKIIEWLKGYYDSGNRVPNKVYARAMTFVEGGKWLSDEEYEVKTAELNKERDIIHRAIGSKFSSATL